MINHQNFFQTEVPQLLNRFAANTKPLWGTMSATKMLQHLLAGTQIMLSKRVVPLTVDEEKLPRYKAFLMSDKPFGESLPKPELYHEYESLSVLEFESVRTDFLNELEKFEAATKSQTDFWCFHPSFGKLNAEETRQLQFKHIRHHFQQFRLM